MVFGIDKLLTNNRTYKHLDVIDNLCAFILYMDIVILFSIKWPFYMKKVILKTRSSRTILISYMYMYIVSYTYVFVHVHVNVNIVNSDTASKSWIFKAQRDIFKVNEVLQVDRDWGERFRHHFLKIPHPYIFLKRPPFEKKNERYVNPDNLT